MGNLSFYARAVFSDATHNTLIQLFRYGIVGAAAFIIDFGLLAFFTEALGIPYLLSACLSFICGVAANYALSIRWVFRGNADTEETDRGAEFLLFLLIGVAGLGFNALIMWALTERVGFHYLFSKIASTIIVFFWNFFARRTLLSKFTYLWKRKKI